MSSLPRLHNALALLLAAGLFAASIAGCETTPPPSVSTPAPSASASASAVAAATSSIGAPAGPRPTAKEADGAVVIGERQTFRSTVLGEDRTILVHMPASYKEGKAAYPVLYLLDGEEHFHHTTGITTFLSSTERAPEMIVVGVASTERDRDRDLTPTEPKDRPGGGGGAAKFLTFLEDELRPRLEGAYRTAPYRILVGHSLGGLFAVNTLTTAPGSFNAYVAISPSLWWDEGLMLRQAEKFFAAPHEDLQAFLYFTVGTESAKSLEDNRSLAATLKAKAPRGMLWEFKHLERESHHTTPHRSTYEALEALFMGWGEPPAEVVTVKALQAHYEALSKRFPFRGKISEAALNNFVFKLMEKNHDEAIAAAQLSVQLHPDSPGAHDTLGSLYEMYGKLDLAKASYELAVRKGTEASDPWLPHLKKKLENVSKPKAK